MEEPWNGPHNSELVSRMPPVFRARPTGTATGHDELFLRHRAGRTKRGKRSSSATSPTGGHDDRMVVELGPRQLAGAARPDGRGSRRGEHRRGPRRIAVHGRGDRGVRRRQVGASIPRCWTRALYAAADVDRETLRAPLTIDGGEKIDPAAIEAIPSSSQGPSGESYVWPGVWVLLGVEVAFIVFAIIRRLRLARRIEREVPHGDLPRHSRGRFTLIGAWR